MAAISNMSYVEVLQNESQSLSWKDITISAGAAGVSVDSKCSEFAGGYGFKDSGRVASPARNRSIYWRTSKDCLELVEVSLDYNLFGNAVRYHFRGAPIIHDISVHESHGNVYILVATAYSVHRLIFPHPNRLQKYEHKFSAKGDHTMASIFSEASAGKVHESNNSHSINAQAAAGTPSATAHTSTTAAAWLNSDAGGEALFALATTTGSILLVKLPPSGLAGVVVQHEMKQSSMMSRLWTGLVPASLTRGSGGGDIPAASSLSLVVQPIGQETFVFAVCRDHKLRMWSVKTQECVLVTDLLDYMPDDMDRAKIQLSGCGHVIKKCSGSTLQSMRLVVHINVSPSGAGRFCVLQPVMANGRYQLRHVITLFSTEDDLVDFCLTPNFLWTVWNTTNEETKALAAPLSLDMNTEEQWLHVEMNNTELSDPVLTETDDPKIVYMNSIFYPGRFSIETLLKALNIYKRSLDPSQLVDSHIPIEALKAEVESVVDHEVESVMQYEMGDDEYLELQAAHWAKFYSRCVQYHQRSMKTVGIYADGGGTGLVGVIRRGGMSYLRPSQAIEHLYLRPANLCSPDQLAYIPLIGEDEQLSGDVLSVCDCIQSLHRVVGEDVQRFLEDGLYRGECPQQMAQSIITNIINDPSDGDHMELAQEMDLQLQGVGNLLSALDAMLLLLDLLQQDQMQDYEEEEEDAAMDAGRQLSVGHLFASGTAVKLLCTTVEQLSVTRLCMTRDLLLLLTLLTQRATQFRIDLVRKQHITQELIPRASQLLQAYFVLKWASTVAAIHPAYATIEHNQRQLESLELSDMGAAAILHNASGLNLKALELFVAGCGGQRVRELLSREALFDEDPCELWSNALIPTAITIMKQLWPLGSSIPFGEFLFSHCQYESLLEYVILCGSWCERIAASSKFLQGAAMLNINSDGPELLQCFLSAAQGVSSEDFLIKLLQSEGQDQRHLDVLYYLKVLKLFEQFSLPDLIITLATSAISVSEPDDPNIPTLWSKIFKQQLELSNNEDAYNALISNPDPSYRKDCLRQLIVVLCERGELGTLVDLPYKEKSSELEDEVVDILESRARAIDLTKHNYYHLLYAFHVYRLNYRKAGSVMYEYGMRVGVEVPGLKGLQCQAKCLLAALNALRLVDPQYAWIVHPLTNSSSGSDGSQASSGVKHTLGGEAIDIPCTRRVDIVELEEMEKEYMLVNARLQLLQKDPNPDYMTGPTASADETVGLLVAAGQFDLAISVCRIFELPLTSVFEGLTSRCINLAENSGGSGVTGSGSGGGAGNNDNEYTAEAWSWLQDNHLPTSLAGGKDTSAVDAAWHLLQHYLEEHEEPSTSRYHRATATRCLSHRFPLPQGLTASYKKVNGAELLRLYLQYDYIHEAGTVALEYVEAVLGKGHEYFGLSTALHCNTPPVWLPYTTLDQLMPRLQEAGRADPTYKQLYDQLQQCLDRYLKTVESVSEDIVELKQQSALTMKRQQRDERLMHQQTRSFMMDSTVR